MTDENLLIIFKYLKGNSPTHHELFEKTNEFSWSEFLSIIGGLISKEYIKYVGEDRRIILTEIGQKNLTKLENRFKQNELDNAANSKKLRNEATLTSWKRKTFWPAFFIALFGGLYSIYDSFIKTPKILKDVQELQLSKEQMELELSKLQTSISDQKNQDSLSPTNFESSK